MKIGNFKSEQQDNLFKVSATMVWEDRDRPLQDLYIATSLEFAKDISWNPHSFLVACIMLAFYYDERRIIIDAEICPRLIDNLNTAMSLVKSWYNHDRSLVEIQAKIQPCLPKPPTPERAGMFFTGGVDTLATLRLNRLHYPLHHPGSIKDGLFIYGFSDTTLDNFEKAYSSFDDIKKDAQITLIPVYTNIYSHIKDLEKGGVEFWRYYYTGAALSAIGHAFSNRITSVAISSSDEIPYLAPWGTHPLLDPNYSSYNLAIFHEYIHLSRFNKTKLVAQWNLALQNIRVCDQLILPPGYLNCGQCSKCVATMAQFAAIEVLDKTSAFPDNDISAKQILAKSNIQHRDEEAYYLELINFFKKQRRYDLIYSIKLISIKFSYKLLLKKIDAKIFKGVLYILYLKIRKLSLTET